MKDFHTIGATGWLMIGAFGVVVALGVLRGRALAFRRWGGMEIVGFALTLLLCTLIVERTVEVYSLTLRARNESQRTRDVEIVLGRLSLLDAREAWVRERGEPYWNDGRSERTVAEELRTIQRERYEQQMELDLVKHSWAAYEGRSARRRALLALVLGGMIAALGVRTLTHLFEKSGLEELPGATRRAFTVADIFLTAGLLAGGSEILRRLFLLLADAPHKV